MFNWFNKKKTVKILVVVNDDVKHAPIEYKNKIDVDLKTEIRAACSSLAISYDDKMINDIASALESGNTYWRAEHEPSKVDYGFEVIEIEV